MADQKISELTENTAPALVDLLAQVDDPSGTPATKKMTILKLWSILNLQRGLLINGKIVPSVASDDITVAIKGLDGNDPSATNPVYIRIGDTVRTITAALSVTKAAGTNWFDSGSTELATQVINYFVYLGYNATDGVVIGFARIPHVSEYGTFSATTTNEKYCAISTITNAAAGDDYENIGRFAATLSAGAGYTWTVPTFSNINLIQNPIYESRWLTWTPTFAAIGSMTYTSVTTDGVNYKVKQREFEINLYFIGTTGGTASDALTATLPLTLIGTNAIINFCVTVRDGSSGDNLINGLAYSAINRSYLNIKKGDSSNWGLGSGRHAYVTGRAII